MHTCIRAFVCIRSCVLACVCVGVLFLYLSLSVPPFTVTCSPFLLIVLPFCQARESGARPRRKSFSLIELRGKANSEMHKHRKFYFPHAGSSRMSFTLLCMIRKKKREGHLCPQMSFSEFWSPLSHLWRCFSELY